MSAQQAPAPQAAPDWTYRRILDWTQDALRKHGSDSPRVEAEILLAHAADCQRILLYTRLDEPTPEAVRQTMRSLVQRRMKAEPVAYLVGRREFFSLDFAVSAATLIPRPETETLVMAGLDWLAEHPGRRAVLDVGTGTGCVAAAVAKECADAQVTAVDVSPEAAEVARGNVERLKLSDRVEVLKSDLFAAVAGRTFDLILSNPPYVRTGEIAGLDADVRAHEPHSALDGGADGLDVVRRLIAKGPAFLTPGGRMALEVDPSQIQSCRELFAASGWADVSVAKDANGDERVISATRG